MNIEELVRDSLQELAAQEPVAGPRFADRVLTVRRHRRTRRLASAAAATAAVVAITVGVPLLNPGKNDVRPPSVLPQNGLTAHPDQSPPRDMIAAGNTVLAAYSTVRSVPQSGTQGTSVRTYSLLDSKTGKYKKDSRWSFVAVAPGLKTAAVLEQSLPVHRIGLLDLATGNVERWIPVTHAVGGLAFSYDGHRLAATTYDANPDALVKEKVKYKDHDKWTWTSPSGKSSRSGFYDLDVASGQGSWTAVAPDRSVNARQDFSFSRTGELVYAHVVGSTDGMQQFYDHKGEKVTAPVNEKYLRTDVEARLSPNGRLAALGLTKEVGGHPGKSYSLICDPRTGKEITTVRGGQLLAWVDDKRLIAWERVTSLEETYRPQLVLVTIGSDKVLPLSGVSEQDIDGGLQWQPVLARR